MGDKFTDFVLFHFIMSTLRLLYKWVETSVTDKIFDAVI